MPGAQPTDPSAIARGVTLQGHVRRRTGTESVEFWETTMGKSTGLKYKIVGHCHKEDLESDVNKPINKGWVPHGGVCVSS